MTVHYEPLTQELESEGRVSVEVVGLRYIGEKSSVAPTKPRRQGGWPGVTPFQQGRLQIGLSPDWIDRDTVSGGDVAGLENLPDDEWEVVYDPAELAAELLSRNYLPESLFGSKDSGYVQPVREAVFEKLGIEKSLPRLPEGEEEIKRELAEIAGVDYEGVATDDGVVAEYNAAATRSQALEAAAALGMDVDETTPKSDAVEFLVDTLEADARDALRAAGVDGV